MTDRELLEAAAKAVDYLAETGEMLWREKESDGKESRRWNARYAGEPVGTLDRGYLRAVFLLGSRKRRLRVHHLAWFIGTGEMVDGEIDHRNGDRSDNRLSNLRSVSRSDNMRNRKASCLNTSGHVGVTWHKQCRKWAAQASFQGARVHLGLFDSKDDAAAVAAQFRLERGFTERHVRAAAAIGGAK